MDINQKQLGAYYTKEDISEYIAKNTIIPFLFGAVEKQYPLAFEPDGPIWHLLRENPDRYMYEALRREQRLPMETEREHVVRRKRHAEMRAKLVAGEIASIDDLITYNLDIGRFALDVIEQCEDADLLHIFYESLEHMTILDPACGSGAFLLAALYLLMPLYEGCLERIEGRGNRRYFIVKAIIRNNLFGVDIMEEAVEVCKRCLYDKAMKEFGDGEDGEFFRELDHHIRVGNALVGFASINQSPYPTDALKLAPCLAWSTAQGWRPTCSFFAHRARDQRLRPCIWGMHSKAGAAQNRGHVSNDRYPTTRCQLDRILAGLYSIDPQDAPAFERWRESHRPFHWEIEFEQVMRKGGFDVIIGNPPYAEYGCVKEQYTLPPGMYETESCGNLYAFCMERFAALGSECSTSGLIVPLSIICTGRMTPVRQILYTAYSRVWFNNYDTIPGTLFPGIVQRNSIVLARKNTNQHTCDVYTTRNQKWYACERASLFENVAYLRIGPLSADDLVPKIGSSIALNILNKIDAQQCAVTSYIQRRSDNTFVYKRRWSYFLLFADTVEGIMLPNGSIRQQKDVKTLALHPELDRYVFIALLSSSLFYFHYSVFSDFRHVNKTDFERFAFDYKTSPENVIAQLSRLGRLLIQSYRENLEWRTCNYVGSIGECRVPFYRQGVSKPIIDAIDAVLAEHYGLTEEELDFIINYDGKYRMGEIHGT